MFVSTRMSQRNVRTALRGLSAAGRPVASVAVLVVVGVWGNAVSLAGIQAKTGVSAQKDVAAGGSASAMTPQSLAGTFEKDQVDLAVDKAIQFLLTKQKADGAIADRQYATAMTALSIMALASVGVQAGDPTRQGAAMSKALGYVLDEKRHDSEGYLGRADRSRMYGHGITTLMLTELLGMGTDAKQDKLIEQRCQQAVDLILRAQQQKKSRRYQGGWRYTPTATDADLSVTIWQLMALRSAKNDGLNVPANAIEQAVEYLQRSYVSTMDRNGMPDRRASGFCYTPGQTRPTYAMTAAGLLAMQVCGRYDSPLVAGAADWLLQHPPKWKERYFFYGTYYYAQGMYQRGGDYAKTARRIVQDLLLSRQQHNGAWNGQGTTEARIGSVYCTALAVLSLSVKYHYLPIYQK